MKVKVYSYAKCSTCTKALKYLKAEGIEPIVIDITEKAPSKTELKSMLKSYDGELKKLFNTSGVVYREKKLKDRIGDLSVGEAVDMLTAEGKLVKRPFLIVDGEAKRVGFKEAEWNQVFG